MKFNSLLITLLITIMFSCGSNNGNNQQENQAAQEQSDKPMVVEETPILSLDKGNVPKSLQQLMDAQQLSVDEQRIYLLRANAFLSNSWISTSKIDSSLFENLNLKYCVLGEFTGITMGFEVTEDCIKVGYGDGRAADVYTVTALEIDENSYTINYDQYGTPVKVNYISNKDGYMLTNDKMAFILYDSMSLLPYADEVNRNPRDLLIKHLRTWLLMGLLLELYQQEKSFIYFIRKMMYGLDVFIF